jgi:hypothetical protein
MSDGDAITRAKADIAEFDRKINVIEAEQTRLEAQKRQMMTERDQIRAFVAMYQRYATEAPPPADSGAASGGNGADHAASPASSAPTPDARPRRRRLKLRRRIKIERKPKQVPEMPKMIVEALQEALKRGLSGLEPKGMTEFIRQKYWPHVKGESVSPIAWRMAQVGQLRKDGSVYSLPTP